MKWQCICMLGMVVILVLSGCIPRAGQVTSISLDFPHGEARVLIHRDRGAHLFYAALPTSQPIREGVFDIDAVYEQLQPRLHPVVPSEAQPPGQPYGMAMLGFPNGDDRSYLIYDEDYAMALLARACDNRIEDGEADTAVLDAVCVDILDRKP
ncbi:MAG: hypothetical protein JXB35_00995 [Anaerolineae bacterium]|nr:hypothetical protein [Anaerolineae bacterium]